MTVAVQVVVPPFNILVDVQERAMFLIYGIPTHSFLETALAVPITRHAVIADIIKFFIGFSPFCSVFVRIRLRFDATGKPPRKGGQGV